jgi:reverse gyrase
MSECWCDHCGGKTTEYSANVKICQECKKIPNLDTLLDLLTEIGAQEETIKNLKKDLHYVPT